MAEEIQKYKKDKWDPAKVSIWRKQREDALERKNGQLQRYARTLRILDKYEWKFEENWDKIVKDVSSLVNNNDELAEHLLDIVMGLALVNGNPNTAKTIGAEAFNHLRSGMYTAQEIGDLYNHKEYAKLILQITGVLQDRKISDTTIGLFKKGDSKGIIASGDSGQVIKAIRAAMKEEEKDA